LILEKYKDSYESFQGRRGIERFWPSVRKSGATIRSRCIDKPAHTQGPWILNQRPETCHIQLSPEPVRCKIDGPDLPHAKGYARTDQGRSEDIQRSCFSPQIYCRTTTAAAPPRRRHHRRTAARRFERESPSPSDGKRSRDEGESYGGVLTVGHVVETSTHGVLRTMAIHRRR
jgi:hypothetical protein